MKEDAFFQHIAMRLGRRSPLREAPMRDIIGAPDFWKTADFGNVANKFKRELGALGGEVHVCADGDELTASLGEFLESLSPSRVGVWGGDFVDRHGLGAMLAEYEVVHWGPSGVAEFESVDVSVSGCAYAIADTGTLVLMSSDTKGRSVALLPLVHIVILGRSQIRARLGEVLQELGRLAAQGREGVHGAAGSAEEGAGAGSTGSAEEGAGAGSGLPASVHFISGPSRSSDIENDQTIGIHGPAAVIVFMVLDA